jgi:hypothetical protein
VIEDRALWHVGLWEWTGSTAVFLFVLAAALFLPEIASTLVITENSTCMKERV